MWALNTSSLRLDLLVLKVMAQSVEFQSRCAHFEKFCNLWIFVDCLFDKLFVMMARS